MFQKNDPSNAPTVTDLSKMGQAVLSNGGDEMLVANLQRKIKEQKLLIQQKDKRICELEKAVGCLLYVEYACTHKKTPSPIVP